MGTNKRYADKIDQRAEQRRQAVLEAAHPGWHPRRNAFPNRWVCRNGRWGTVFGEVEGVDTRRAGLPVTVYLATVINEGVRTPLGEFPTGDAAVEALWLEFMNRVKRST